MANSLLIVFLLFVALALLCVLLIRVFKRPDPRTKIIDGAELTGNDPSNHLLQAVFEFCKSDGWQKARHVLENYPELLSDDTDHILESLISKYAQQKTAKAAIARKTLLHRRNLIRRSKEVGVEQAIAEAMETHKSLARIVWEFCKEDDSLIGREMLKTHPELVSDQADDILQELIDDFRKEKDYSTVTRLVQRRVMLRWVKEVGIDAAVKHDEPTATSY